MVVIVTVCPAFGLTVSDAKTEIMCLRTRGMPDATATFSVEAVGQVYKQTHEFVYLGGNVNHHADLSIEVDRRIRNAWCSSREYFRKLHQVLRMRRSTSMDRLAWWSTFPPRYTNSCVHLYTWPAASTLNLAVASGIPLVRKHMISVLASGTVRPNAAHTVTITTIIFLSCSGDCETTPASSAYSMPHSEVAGLALRPLFPPAPPLPFFS